MAQIAPASIGIAPSHIRLLFCDIFQFVQHLDEWHSHRIYAGRWVLQSIRQLQWHYTHLRCVHIASEYRVAGIASDFFGSFSVCYQPEIRAR